MGVVERLSALFPTCTFSYSWEIREYSGGSFSEGKDVRFIAGSKVSKEYVLIDVLISLMWNAANAEVSCGICEQPFDAPVHDVIFVLERPRGYNSSGPFYLDDDTPDLLCDSCAAKRAPELYAQMIAYRESPKSRDWDRETASAPAPEVFIEFFGRSLSERVPV